MSARLGHLLAKRQSFLRHRDVTTTRCSVSLHAVRVVTILISVSRCSKDRRTRRIWFSFWLRFTIIIAPGWWLYGTTFRPITLRSCISRKCDRIGLSFIISRPTRRSWIRWNHAGIKSKMFTSQISSRRTMTSWCQPSWSPVNELTNKNCSRRFALKPESDRRSKFTKRSVILLRWQEVTLEIGWHLFAVAIMSNHFHVVLASQTGQTKEDYLRTLKARASFALNKKYGKRTWWTTSGSVRYCFDAHSLEARIEYVMKQKNPLVVWRNQEEFSLRWLNTHKEPEVKRYSAQLPCFRINSHKTRKHGNTETHVKHGKHGSFGGVPPTLPALFVIECRFYLKSFASIYVRHPVYQQTP